MLYTVCLWRVCAYDMRIMSEIPIWFKSIVFVKAACCLPLWTSSIAVDMFMLFLLFSQITVLTGLHLVSCLYFSGLYFLSDALLINKHILKLTR